MIFPLKRFFSRQALQLQRVNRRVELFPLKRFFALKRSTASAQQKTHLLDVCRLHDLWINLSAFWGWTNCFAHVSRTVLSFTKNTPKDVSAENGYIILCTPALVSVFLNTVFSCCCFFVRRGFFRAHHFSFVGFGTFSVGHAYLHVSATIVTFVS